MCSATLLVIVQCQCFFDYFQVQFNDDQQGNQLGMFSSGNPEQCLRIVGPNYQAPPDGKRKVLVKSQAKKGSNAPDVKKSCDIIKIRATDKLIHYVREKSLLFVFYELLRC